ncbi:RND family efflux transporter MFP subunit [Sporomusa sp. KB1]|nr:RND family efflux transporter MFP subunit [Sporomusa sp. KB1]
MQYHIVKGKKKWYYGLAAAVMIICIIGGVLWKENHQAKPTVDTNIPLVRTVMVNAVETSRSYTYPGEVRGRYESQLAFQVGGKIIRRSVDLGATVQAGEVLMQLEPKDLQQAANSSSAQLMAAQAQLKLAESNLSRYRQLYEQAAVSRAQFDQYQNSYDVALAEVHRAAAQHEQGANKLDYTLLVADQPGVIAAIGAEIGQVVSAGQTVLTIVRDGEREIEISIPENRLEDLRQATQCKVTFWALPSITVDGSIREIAPMANATSRTYKVRITLVTPPPEVKLGMTAAVLVTAADQQAAAITIPLSALYQTGDTPRVWVVKDNTVGLRPVTVGVGSSDTIQVLAGLQPGETIVTAGVHKLRDGQQIRIASGDRS